jgi:Protein kinase domain
MRDASSSQRKVLRSFRLSRARHIPQRWIITLTLGVLIQLFFLFLSISYVLYHDDLISSFQGSHPSLIPTLRSPRRIKYVNSRYLMESVGYPIKPRVLGVYFPLHTSPKLSSLSLSYTAVQKLPLQLHRRLDHHSPKVKMSQRAIKNQIHLWAGSEDYEDSRTDPFEHDSCLAPYMWMKASFPTCNTLHELDLSNSPFRINEIQVTLEGSGYWRDIWKIQYPSRFEPSPLILKTIRYLHDFEERNYDRHRRDAVATERLTWSTNIIHIYSFCANSAIYEFAPGGDIESALWYRENDKSNSSWTSSERLIIAYQVASGIADAHNSERNGIPAIAHTDITTSQFVHVDGIYKLNDFNRCRFLTYDVQRHKNCDFRVGNNPGTFRSPEEYAYALESEKVDIYSMGNVFYSILTEVWPYDDENNDKAQASIQNGARPQIPFNILHSEDPMQKVLIHIIQRCWQQDPKARPTAKEVKQYLEHNMKQLGIDV